MRIESKREGKKITLNASMAWKWVKMRGSSEPVGEIVADFSNDLASVYKNVL